MCGVVANHIAKVRLDTHTPRTPHTHTHTQHTYTHTHTHTQRERRASDKCPRKSRTGWRVSGTTAAKHTHVCLHAHYLSVSPRHFLLRVFARARVLTLLLLLSLPPFLSLDVFLFLFLSLLPPPRLSLPPLRLRKGGETAADAASSGQLDGAATDSAHGDVGERLPRQAFMAQHPLPVARIVRYFNPFV